MAMFNSKMLNYQRVTGTDIPFIDGLPIKNGDFHSDVKLPNGIYLHVFNFFIVYSISISQTPFLGICVNLGSHQTLPKIAN